MSHGVVSPPTQQLVLRTRWEQLAGRLGGATKKSPAECAGCRRGPDLPTAPGRAPQPRGGAQVGPTRLSLSQEPSLRVTARGPPTDQRARELAAAGGATAGVASSCPHPHRPVLLEIVGDGPVPGRLVTLQPSSRAMTQTPPCRPERTRAHGPGSCGARVVSPAGADPRSGTALSRPQSRPPAPELGPHFLSCLLGFPIFVSTPALLTTPCSGCAFACGRVSVCAHAFM